MNAVEVQNLSVRFGEFTAVDTISFHVKPGEIFGFLGANGAGKTTTIRVLTGLLPPSEGMVRVAGLTFEDGEQAIKSRVGYMSQRFTLYNDLSVQENLSFAAGLRKIPPAPSNERIKRLLNFIQFGSPLKTLVQNLPGGLKQEVSLVAALLHDPEIVFLDEPTAGVSPSARARFWGLIRSLAKEGKTIFVTTHYMDEAEECGRIALMRAGRVIALGSPSELKKQAFPERLMEIQWKDNPPPDWHRSLLSGPAVSVVPYGLYYHVLIQDPVGWAQFLSTHADHMVARDIPPSLEDVFIRLVEGVER
ncbi:MAG: ABC transporter ATP-binding protein [Elusimicrobia bacterium]|jgi:ABC-2 type transport system ATP-binding protein|nr:ABC transporter ATP-binding protein [Elusimicrobiota bacterium]